MRDLRISGSMGAKPRGGDLGSRCIEAYRAIVLAAIVAQVDITLTELADMLRHEHGASFARSAVWRLLDRQGITMKQNSARRRSGSARRRRAATDLARRRRAATDLVRRAA